MVKKKESKGKESSAKSKERHDKAAKKEKHGKAQEKKSKELSAKEKKSKESTGKEKASKEKSSKEKAGKERTTKERSLKAERHTKERTSKQERTNKEKSHKQYRHQHTCTVWAYKHNHYRGGVLRQHSFCGTGRKDVRFAARYRRRRGFEASSFKLSGGCKQVQLWDEDACRYGYGDNMNIHSSTASVTWDLNDDICGISMWSKCRL